MARLPTPGGDKGNWGDILNDFLSQSLATDGSLKDSTVTNVASQAVVSLQDSNLSGLADAGSARSNLGVPALAAVMAVATTNVASLSGTTTIDGRSLVANDRVLLTAQTTGSQNGPWLVKAGAWTRPSDYATGSSITGCMIEVMAGSLYAGYVWLLTTTTPVIVGTTASTWVVSNSVDSLAQLEIYFTTSSSPLGNSNPAPIASASQAGISTPAPTWGSLSGSTLTFTKPGVYAWQWEFSPTLTGATTGQVFSCTMGQPFISGSFSFGMKYQAGQLQASGVTQIFVVAAMGSGYYQQRRRITVNLPYSLDIVGHSNWNLHLSGPAGVSSWTSNNRLIISRIA
jgi:phage-related tail fiber protein